MFMSFRHFDSCAYDPSSRTVSFRIGKNLRWFAKYYKPDVRPDHVLSIKFQADKDANKFLYNVYNVYMNKKMKK